MIALKVRRPAADDEHVIEPIHIPDVLRIAKPRHSEDHQPPPRRRQQPRRDQDPKSKVYTPDGNLEEQESTHIELVG